MHPDLLLRCIQYRGRKHEMAMLILLSVLFLIQNTCGHILRLPCLTYGKFSIVRAEQELHGHVMETFRNLSVDECENQCIEHKDCKSVNTRNSTEVNCKLNSKSAENPFDIATTTSSAGWTYRSTDYKAKNIGPYCEARNPCSPFFTDTCIDTCSFPGYLCQTTHITGPFENCQDAYEKGLRINAIYPLVAPQPFNAPCDMTTDSGGWIVFQRRVDATVDFNRGWADYKAGFGDLDGNFWLGLDRIHELAAPEKGAILRVEIKHMDSNDLPFAEYSKFEIKGEDDFYTLTIESYSGNATNSLSDHNGEKFSTRDKDNDNKNDKNCAEEMRGAWWHKDCDRSNLNGEYPSDGSHSKEYISWYKFNDKHGRVTFSEMKLKYGP